MIIVPGQAGKDLCDPQLGMTRRDILRVGGSGLLGLSLGSMLQLQAASARAADIAGATAGGGPGWGKAKSIIMVYLQGGPSHLDLWDPKENVPDNVKSVFKKIATKVPGIDVTENLPRLAQITDKFTFIRSMSYTPNGLFNHTAAIYQMMTGYTTDKVSPSGQLEPPSPKDFPNFGSQIIRLRPQTVPMLPFVMLPRPLQESNVVGKGGTAGFLGKAFDPYTLFPEGDDMDMTKMDRIKVDDLQLRPEVFALRLQRRAKLRDALNAGMKSIDEAVSDYKLNEYYDRALSLVVSGRARDAFNLQAEDGQDPRPVRPEHVRPELPAGPPPGRGRHEGRRGHLAQGRQLRQPLLGPPRRPDQPDARPVRPHARPGPLRPAHRPGPARAAEGDAGRRRRRVRPQPAEGRQHLGQRQQCRWPRPLAVLLHGRARRRRASGAGHIHGQSDKTGSAPLSDPVHPGELLATIYHAFGIDPATMVFNHLNQPRELVKADAVTRLFG